MNNNFPSDVSGERRLLPEQNNINSSDRSHPQSQSQQQLQSQQIPQPRKKPLHCKSCGGTDHCRKSSKKCRHYQPKSSNNNPPSTTTTQQTNDNNTQSSNLESTYTTTLLSPDEYAASSKKVSSSYDRLTVLKDVLIQLKETAVLKSILPSMSDVECNNFLDEVMWEDMLRVQRCNVDSCLAEKKTQLSKRTMKLALMDVDSCTKFSELNNTVLKRGNKASMFWQACLYEACDEFIKVARKLDYSNIPLEHIPDLIEKSFAVESHDISALFTDAEYSQLYYIAGWTLNALVKVSARKKDDLATALLYFTNFCTSSEIEASSNELPSEIVSRKNAFDGLTFVKREYFVFILRLELVFCKILSEEESILLHGSFVIAKIMKFLHVSDHVLFAFHRFFSTSCETCIVEKVLGLLLSMYSRMKGKDFARSMHEKNSSLIVTIRQTTAVLSDGRHRSKGSSNPKISNALISSDEFIQNSDNSGFGHMHPGLDQVLETVIDEENSI